MRYRPLVCQYLSPIKRALEGCLQQQSEYYLHLGWKGSHFLHQKSKFRTRERGHYRMRGLQESRRQILFLFRMMTPIWAHKAQSLERSSRSNKPHSKFISQPTKSQVDRQISGEKKQTTRGSTNHNGAKKHTRKRTSCQKEESQIQNT